jgi:hypothetical protein
LIFFAAVFNGFVESDEGECEMTIEQIEGGLGHEVGHHQEEGHVEVLYNGLKKKVEFKFTETMGTLRQRAVNEFGNPPAPHALSLFTKQGVEFGPDKDQLTIRQARIKNGEELLLRPGVVRGG